MRDFSLSTRSAPTIATLDSLDRLAPTLRTDSSSYTDSVRADLALSGGALLTGTSQRNLDPEIFNRWLAPMFACATANRRRSRTMPAGSR